MVVVLWLAYTALAVACEDESSVVSLAVGCCWLAILVFVCVSRFNVQSSAGGGGVAGLQLSFVLCRVCCESRVIVAFLVQGLETGWLGVALAA